jgi:hypothetical protein
MAGQAIVKDPDAEAFEREWAQTVCGSAGGRDLKNASFASL